MPEDKERAAPRGWRRPVTILALILVVSVIATPVVLAGVGRWLIVADELVPADAIFVHAGHLPLREMEAADLYLAGLAPEIWLAPIAPTRESLALDALGIERPPSWHWRKEVLIAMGVPADAIHVLSGVVLNTGDEVNVVAHEMIARGTTDVILVTSKQHTRRVHATWRKLAPATLHARLAPSRYDRLDPDRWWANTDHAQAVLHEIAALVNVWLGFGLRPSEP